MTPIVDLRCTWDIQNSRDIHGQLVPFRTVGTLNRDSCNTCTMDICILHTHKEVGGEKEGRRCWTHLNGFIEWLAGVRTPIELKRYHYPKP